MYHQPWEQPDFDTHVFTRCHFSSSFCRSFSWTMKVISCNRKNSEGEKRSASWLRWSSICSPCSPAETALKGLCSWCALPNSAYFLHISLFAILNRDLRFYKCMLHSETTARTSRIVCSPEDWSPQGSAGFALISGDFRASGADSQRKPVCLHGKIMASGCVSSSSSRAEKLCSLWRALWSYLVSAPCLLCSRSSVGRCAKGIKVGEREKILHCAVPVKVLCWSWTSAGCQVGCQAVWGPRYHWGPWVWFCIV